MLSIADIIFCQEIISLDKYILNHVVLILFSTQYDFTKYYAIIIFFFACRCIYSKLCWVFCWSDVKYTAWFCHLFDISV